jgi:hypothetical protein
MKLSDIHELPLYQIVCSPVRVKHLRYRPIFRQLPKKTSRSLGGPRLPLSEILLQRSEVTNQVTLW